MNHSSLTQPPWSRPSGVPALMAAARRGATCTALCIAALPALAQGTGHGSAGGTPGAPNAVGAAGTAAAAGMNSLGPSFRPQVLAAPAAPAAQAAAPGTAAATAGAASTADALVPAVRVLVTGPQRAVATVEGRLVRVGDLVQGRRVLRIDPQGVVLSAEAGPPQRLAVRPAAISKKASPAAAEPTNDRNPR